MKPSITVSFDKKEKELLVYRASLSAMGLLEEHSILKFRLPEQDFDLEKIEQTLGEIILFHLNKMTQGGLGFGNYDDLFERIKKENIAFFTRSLDLSLSDDQYDLALILFSKGRQDESWDTVKRAVDLFKAAALQGHKEAQHFVNDNLPILLPRLEQKLKGKI